MKRFNLVAAVLVAGLALVVTGGLTFAQDDSEDATVGFSVNSYLELDITNGSSVDLGTLDPSSQTTASADDATQLKVSSNTSWQISVGNKQVSSQPNNGNLSSSQLSVNVGTTSGTGTKGGIQVDYELSKVDTLRPGDYQMTVTYTASTQ
ncbi:MAG: hypothetical protein ABEK03_03250 [Candidatus Bipolaricaulia bacterium]